MAVSDFIGRRQWDHTTGRRLTQHPLLVIFASVPVVILLSGCAAGGSGGKSGGGAHLSTRPSMPPAVGTDSTAPSLVTFDGKSYGIRLDYPAHWHLLPASDDDTVLRLVPASRGPTTSGSAREPEIKLIVPRLPPHIPGWIPIGSVESGYIDDLKKYHPGVKIDETTSVTIPRAKARLVRSTWPVDGGGEQNDVALLIVHGDRVYILDLDAPADGYASARGVFDGIVRSIVWTD